MKMSESQRIEAPRQTVWEALNDADVLKASIPGCEELTKHSDTEMEAKVKLKVGPVKATFGGKVTLEDLNPPESYRIVGEGSGGVAGFAKGGATVRLEEDGPDATILHYDVDAQIGGKLAQLGSRLIDSTARRLAGEFFKTFGEQVAPTQPQEEEAAASEGADAPAEEKKGWLGGLFGGKKDEKADETAAS
ncbi:SRPBCC family protein [Roseibium sp.]|uniref:SRPBCC family protein n=1 Tax=Roseibium sp. TaxID=1936156 RepID=UPI003A975B31